MLNTPIGIRGLAACCLLLLGGIGATPVSAATPGVLFQLPVETVKSNDAFGVAGDYVDVVDSEATGFRLYINDKLITTAGREVLVNGVVTFSGIRLAKGTYTLRIASFNESGEGLSDPLSLSVVPGNPSAPRNLRIIRVIVQ